MSRWFVGGDHRGERGGFRQLVVLVEKVKGLLFAALVQFGELLSWVVELLEVGVAISLSSREPPAEIR